MNSPLNDAWAAPATVTTGLAGRHFWPFGEMHPNAVKVV